MNTSKLKQLEAIFSEAPKKVKYLANTLYQSKCTPQTLTEVFTQQNMEPYQVRYIEETILKAFNLYLSNVNTLILRLHTLKNEAA